ncbi:MAG TPA: SgcJ/EcaC family oxidoreductase [Candidatus Eisenbacteria bacterium]|nr:SgcJ/EcaC family oxidoreductase [Candidatus Eisenbacteria bacterium]
MRFSRAGWLIGLLALVGCAGMTQKAAPPVDQAAIAAAIDSINAAYLAGITARDTTALVNLYADDGRVMPPNAPPAEGKDAIRQAWVGFLSIPGMTLSTTSTAKMISEAGDMAVDIGTYTFSGTDPKGKPMTDNGKYSTVLKKVNGEWKIAVDMFSSNVPIPGM